MRDEYVYYVPEKHTQENTSLVKTDKLNVETTVTLALNIMAYYS